MWMAWIGHAYMAADGAYREATEILDRALELGREHGSTKVIAYAQAWRVYTLWWLGRIDEAVAAGEEGSALFAALPDEPYVWFKARCGVGMVFATMGKFEEATEIGDELIAFGGRSGSARSKAMGHLVHINVANLAVDEPATGVHARAILEATIDPIYEHSPVPRLFSLIAADKVAEARSYHDDHYERYIVGLHLRLLAGFFAMADGALQIREGKPREGFAQLEAVEAAAVQSGEGIYQRYAGAMIAIAYAKVAMASPSVGYVFRNARFAAGRGRRPKKQAIARLTDLLSHLAEWGMEGLRFQLEWTLAQLLVHEGDAESAAAHLEAGIAAIEPAGNTEGLRTARAFLEQLRR